MCLSVLLSSILLLLWMLVYCCACLVCVAEKSPFLRACDIHQEEDILTEEKAEGQKAGNI